ncbi:MAG: cell division protein FtsW [Calditrichaeota bacterium]|nr:MAG: cell division protein FtsW [Calditrichota bacterium]
MKKSSVDPYLLISFFVLMLIGIIMVYSASAFYARQYWGNNLFFLKRHLMWLFLGLIAMGMAYSFPFEKLKGYSAIPLFLGLAILFYAGIITRQRWVYWGPIHFQAVDVAKFTLILFFADSLSRKEKFLHRYADGLFPHLFYLMLMAALVLAQPDFSSAFMLILIGIIMLYVAPVRVQHLVFTGLAFVPPLIGVVLLSPYKLQRVVSFLNPEKDLKGAGYQVFQSLVSFGSGGITGVGFARSTQKMFYLPEAHTDFIFAIIGEELGLIGTLFVIGLFVVITVRGISIALRTTDRFTMYLTVGITSHFALYALINMMVTLRLAPATGLPLPFISYGGTALLFSCVYAGMLLRFSRETGKKPVRSGSPATKIYNWNQNRRESLQRVAPKKRRR